jgi:hypothetical protein
MRNLLIAAVGAVTLSALVACSDTPTSSSLAAPDAGLFSTPGATDEGITPTTHDGNVPGETVEQVCYNLSIDGMEDIEGLLHTKADWKDGLWQHEVDGEWVEWTNDHLSFSTDGSPGKYLDFEANGLVYAVIVNGGPRYNLYDYTPDGIASDGHLHSPVNPGGNVPDISHVNFCYVPGDNGNGYEGCTIGYWMNHDGSLIPGQGPERYRTDSWDHTPYAITTNLGEVFDGAALFGLEHDTFREALEYPGGDELVDAARLLFKQAVAALLSATYDNDGVALNYEWSAGDIIDEVNGVLASGDRQTMLDLAGTFDEMNNAGCPL